MELATGAMGSLLPKLAELLQEEYKLQRGVKKDVESLERELRSIEVALSKVAEVPRDQLDKQVRLWADDVRELSYEIEDVVDSFLVRVEGSERAIDLDTFKGFIKKVAKPFKKVKARHQIADAIKDIKDQVQEVAARRDRYKVDDVHANSTAINTVDPRMLALFKDQRELVGIQEPRDELIKRLTDRDDGVSKQQLKILSIFEFGILSIFGFGILSIFGFGGLGKIDRDDGGSKQLLKILSIFGFGILSIFGFGGLGKIDRDDGGSKQLLKILSIFGFGILSIFGFGGLGKIDRYDGVSKQLLKIISIFGFGILSIFGFGGLCKTGQDDGVYKQQLKILSIFGFGGLGKTTLAKAVYDKLQVIFDCTAFVSVGQNPSLKKVLRDILLELDKPSNSNARTLAERQLITLDETQLIGKLREQLQNKRYLIVVDDIWDVKSWEIIRCAWVDSKCGSIIITTTRILEVAKESSHVHEHKPLSRANSRELFYKRLSIGKDKYSFDRTVEISEKILQKCGGVPLAIVTIASLLANKPSEDWSELYNSIGFGQGDNIHVDNTRKILLFSYYDLPCYLRTCLLHLSIYPEDQKIQKEDLIWKWVGEGFVYEKPGMGSFELGERYFNELINRSMIEPVEEPLQGIVCACRVHDLVLDMIYSLSKEENFVVVLGSNEQHTWPQSNARRIAVQSRVRDQHNPMTNKPMPQVRSFNVMMCHPSMIPSLSGFQALRVLAIEGYWTKDCPYNLEHLGKLLQLRYLRLFNMPITELPEEIGDLRFLQILDLRETLIQKLPQSVGQLSQLKCLRVEKGRQFVWDFQIGNLTSLEKVSLDHVLVDRAYGNYMKELGKLTKLRVFKIILADCDPELFKDMMDSLGNMQRLQALDIECWARDIGWTDGCVLPRHLRHVELMGFLPRLPAWIDSSHLPLLSHLYLRMKAMEAKDMEILGKFPKLRTLRMQISEGYFFPDVIGGGAFPKLRYFYVNAMLRFLQGAMPSLESFDYEVEAVVADFASLGNLPCLKIVRVYIWCDSKSDLQEAEAALRHAVKVHPNNPTLEFLYA